MSYANLWLVDRSRHQAGHDCQAYRYYRYHAGEHGYGMVHISQSVPLLTGGMIHECLADLLRWVKENGTAPDKVVQQLIVSKHTENYRKLVYGRGFQGVEDAEPLLLEQQVLMAGMAYTWCRVVLPMIMEDWEILHVEEEINIPVGSNLLLMLRPDLILRHHRTKEVKVWDWKTAAYINESYIQEWSTSPQMMLTSWGARQKYGYDIKEYYIGALYKGARKREWNEDTAKYDGAQRETSFLVWPYYNEGTPPFVGPQWQTSFTNPCPNPFTCEKARGKRGKPHNHQLGAGWTKTMPTDPHAWSQDIPMEKLQEVHQLLGPYEMDTYKVGQMITSLVANEEEWKEKVRKQYAVEDKAPWENEAVQISLDQVFNRSYNCFSYGRRCAYYDLCFKKPGWRTPLQTGFLPRRPHHQQELDQMKERGVPVPDEFGYFEEEA